MILLHGHGNEAHLWDDFVPCVDVDTNPQISGMLGIRSIPTVLFFKDGQVVDRVIGAMPKPVFAQKIESHL